MSHLAPVPAKRDSLRLEVRETRQTVDMVWSIAARRRPLRAIRALQ